MVILQNGFVRYQNECITVIKCWWETRLSYFTEPKLICFDVDGTLLTDEMENEGQYVKGIIPTETLIYLWKLGHKIAIVSPSPFLPRQFSGDNHLFKRNGSNDYRFENIIDARDYYEMSLLDTIYVDDLEANRKNVKMYVSESFSPEEFLNLIKQSESTEQSNTNGSGKN